MPRTLLQGTTVILTARGHQVRRAVGASLLITVRDCTMNLCHFQTEENDSTGLCYYGRMSNKTPVHLSAAQIASLVEENVGVLAHSLRPDYLQALEASLPFETSGRGREVLGQLMTNARIASENEVPLCQDTGYVWVCLEAQGAVMIPADLFSGVDAAVARAAEAAGMRMSMVHDALTDRGNTGTNTPVFCEVLLKGESDLAADGSNTSSSISSGVSNPDKHSPDAIGSKKQASSRASSADEGAVSLRNNKAPQATLHIMLKGGGSDNASALTMLPPGAGTEGVLDFVVDRVAEKGANACPPLVIGVGVGGTFDKVAGLAKHALLRTVGSTAANPEIAALEAELLARINALGIGPGGLGGSTTALAVHIKSAPCHIAALPVAVNIGCTALRSVSIPLEP